MATNTIYIDVSDAQRKLADLRMIYSKESMNRLTRRVLARTGNKVKSIVSTEVPKKYHIKRKVVAQDVQKPIMGGNALDGPQCTIPIIGQRHIIGGKTFPARGGRHGWKNIKVGKRYKITTQIVKGKTSTLPIEMKDQGGNPPFRNLSAKKLNNATFTRKKGAGFPPKNLPIVRVAGLAVPQMAATQSVGEIQEDIANYMMERIAYEHERLLKECK